MKPFASIHVSCYMKALRTRSAFTLSGSNRWCRFQSRSPNESNRRAGLPTTAHLCMCMCVRVPVCISIPAGRHTHACIHTNIHTYMHAYLHTWTCGHEDIYHLTDNLLYLSHMTLRELLKAYSRGAPMRRALDFEPTTDYEM